MKPGFFSRVLRVVQQADIVLEVLDARFPDLTRNYFLERIALERGKKLILVLNKSDLANMKELQAFKHSVRNSFSVVFLSSTQRKGISRVRKLIFLLAHQLRKKPAAVAIIGYPNCGKSSLINALKGRHSVGTSVRAGFTKGQQFVKLSEDVMLIDSPGVIPVQERDEFFLALIAAKSPDQLQDPESTGVKLIEFIQSKNPRALSQSFQVELTSVIPEEILSELALKKKKVLAGNEPDILTMVEQLILRWQKGQIHV